MANYQSFADKFNDNSSNTTWQYLQIIELENGAYLHDAVWVPWSCCCGCPDCTIARGSGCVALSILRDKHSSGARECGPADLLRAAVLDGLSLPHLHLNIYFSMILYVYIWIVMWYMHSSARILWTCRGGPVTGRRRSDATSIGPIPARLWCAGTHAHWDIEANDGILWTALVTWYFWRHFMLVVVSALAAN